MTLRTRKLHVPAWVSCLFYYLRESLLSLDTPDWAAFPGYAKTSEGKGDKGEEKAGEGWQIR